MMYTPVNEAQKEAIGVIEQLLEDFIRSEDIKMNLRVQIDIALMHAYDEGWREGLNEIP